MTKYKILITEEKGKIVMSPSATSVRELAGIIKVSAKLSDNQLEIAIKNAKRARLTNLAEK